LRAQPYPGNIRELRTLVERAVAFCQGDAIDAATIHLALETGAHEPSRGVASADLGLEIQELERRRIMEALERHGGNQTKAAKFLGMPRRTLVTRLTQYGLTHPRRENKE
jgi:DNA-binding NtrC family response regulator